MRFHIFFSGLAILALGFAAMHALEKPAAIGVLLGALTLGGGLIICGLFSLRYRWHGIIGAGVIALLGASCGIENLAALPKFWFGERDRGPAPELPVTRLSARGRGAWLLAASAATVGWALLIGPWLQAVMPWRDAFIAAFSVAAQVLQVRKQIENWPLWVVVNLVAVASYATAALAYTAFLYALYLGLALAGWREWRRAMPGGPSGA